MTRVALIMMSTSPDSDRLRPRLLLACVALAVLASTVLPETAAAAEVLVGERVQVGALEYQRLNDGWAVVEGSHLFTAHPRVITVRFDDSTSHRSAEALHTSLGARVLRTNHLGFADLELPLDVDPVDAVRAYTESGLVTSAELNAYGSWLALPDDPNFDQQWHLDQANDADIDAPQAWDFTTGSPSVAVAVLDSGTDWTHTDLGPGNDGYQNVWLNSFEDAWSDPNDPSTGNGIDNDLNGLVDDWKGWDFGNNNNDARSSVDHGTRVAGVIGAKTNNDHLVSGVAGGWNAPGAVVMTLGVGESGPDGSVLDDAILYALRKGARVITMSLTVSETSAINAAIEDAYAGGVFINCSSGNGFGPPVSYPARHPEVVAVGATNSDDLKSSFSSWGPEQELAAPGSNILTLVFGNGTGNSDGTSFSSPIVAATAALMFSINPSLTNEEARQALRDTAEKVGPYDYDWDDLDPGRSQELGFGRVNTFEAVMAVAATAGLTLDASGTSPAVALSQNQPNPFNPRTEIRYNLGRSGSVSLKIFNIHGREVRTLARGTHAAGDHTVEWDGRNDAGQQLGSGVYFYRLESGSTRTTRKMLLVE